MSIFTLNERTFFPMDKWGKYCDYSSAFIFNDIFFILVGKMETYTSKSFGVFDFLPDHTVPSRVIRPSATEIFPINL